MKRISIPLLCSVINPVCHVTMIEKDVDGAVLKIADRNFENELVVIQLYADGEFEELIRLFYPDRDTSDIGRLDFQFEAIPGGKPARKKRLVMSFAPVRRYLPCMIGGQTQTPVYFSKEDIYQMAKNTDDRRQKFLLAFPDAKITEDFVIVMKYGLESITDKNVEEILSRTGDGDLPNISFVKQQKNIRLHAYIDSCFAKQIIQIGSVLFIHHAQNPINGHCHHTEFEFEESAECTMRYHDAPIKNRDDLRALAVRFNRDEDDVCYIIKPSPILIEWLVNNVDKITSQEILMFAIYLLGAKPVYQNILSLRGHNVQRENLVKAFRELIPEKTSHEEIAELEDDIRMFIERG